MENASKALIMAGGILIAILVMSLFVYLIVSFGATSDKIHDQNAQTQITEFNAQFTKYQGRTNITIYDIVSVANLARENNKQNFQHQITVKFKDKYSSIIELTNPEEDLVSKIQQQVKDAKGTGKDSQDTIVELNKYKVEEITYDNEGRVNYIYFKYSN